jgi:prepilin-type processing-associated H-X9-DG protein
MEYLKTIALGASNYADMHDHRLPQGTVPLAGVSPEQRFSWQVTLLPFIEQERAYEKIDQQQPWNSPANLVAVNWQFKVYRCPTGIERNAESFPITTYVGMAGVGTDAATLPTDSPRAGVFGYDRIVTIDDIKDGTSNTILAIETFVDNGPWAAGGFATVRGIDAELQPYIGIDRAFGRLHAQRSWFGTMPTSANAAFVDGSVRGLDHSINPSTFEALATMAGGESLRDGDY